MKTDDILQQARERLAAISTERAALDAEEQKLKRILAAADGEPEPVKLMPLPAAPPAQPPPVPWLPPQAPVPMPFQQLDVWWSRRVDHGGACACPQCCPVVTWAGTCTTFDDGAPLGTREQRLDVYQAEILRGVHGGMLTDRTFWVGDTTGTANAIDHDRRYGVS